MVDLPEEGATISEDCMGPVGSIGMRLGSGAFGSVYEACESHGVPCDKVIKMTQYNKRGIIRSGPIDKWRRVCEYEAQLATEGGRLGFGPRVHSAWFCHLREGKNIAIPTHFIVSDRVHGITTAAYIKMIKAVHRYLRLPPSTVKKWTSKRLGMVEKLVRDLIQNVGDQMEKVPEDIHSENVMLTFNPRTRQPQQALIIDWGPGQSLTYEHGKSRSFGKPGSRLRQEWVEDSVESTMTE